MLPTATETELARANESASRHRRAARGGLTLKPRRKKGDKSKNAKMGTMVVMWRGQAAARAHQQALLRVLRAVWPRRRSGTTRSDQARFVEKLWDAGSSIHREGSPECAAWVQAQKTRLYGGKAAAIVTDSRSDSLRSPGNKREALRALSRISAMDYRALRRADLEPWKGQSRTSCTAGWTTGG
jgi:hypothetical protein